MARSLRLLLLCLAIAGAAQAQQLRGPTGQDPAGPSLRGSVAPSAPNTPPMRRAIGLDPVIYGAQGAIQPLPPSGTRVGGLAQQCRMSCAQTYYFCLAGNQIDDCPASWSQCRAGCSSDPISSSY